MISQISIEEFVDKVYPPVHGHRSVYAKKVIKALRNAGITDLKTLVNSPEVDLLDIKNIGPVFISQSNGHLAKIGCELGMSDAKMKEAVLASL